MMGVAKKNRQSSYRVQQVNADKCGLELYWWNNTFLWKKSFWYLVLTTESTQASILLSMVLLLSRYSLWIILWLYYQIQSMIFLLVKLHFVMLPMDSKDIDLPLFSACVVEINQLFNTNDDQVQSCIDIWEDYWEGLNTSVLIWLSQLMWYPTTELVHQVYVMHSATNGDGTNV